MNKKTNIYCRQCGSINLVDRGSISDSKVFCGVKLDPPWSGGRLYYCSDCCLCFRFPVRSSKEYFELYKQSPESTYYSDDLRNDQKLVRDVILNVVEPGCSVLDVGCFNGALLNSIEVKVKKYGIEASKKAAEICLKSGVEIICDDINGLQFLDLKFDVICLVDVIEHLINPKDLMDVAISKLNKNGFLIVSTGDASSCAWRLFGGRYWYCAFPEHVSFISPSWVEGYISNKPLTIVDVKKFQHVNPGIGVAESWLRFLGRFGKALVSVVKSKLLKRRIDYSDYKLGFPGVVNDHMIFMLKLNE